MFYIYTKLTSITVLNYDIEKYILTYNKKKINVLFNIILIYYRSYTYFDNLNTFS